MTTWTDKEQLFETTLNPTAPEFISNHDNDQQTVQTQKSQKTFIERKPMVVSLRQWSASNKTQHHLVENNETKRNMRPPYPKINEQNKCTTEQQQHQVEQYKRRINAKEKCKQNEIQLQALHSLQTPGDLPS